MSVIGRMHIILGTHVLCNASSRILCIESCELVRSGLIIPSSKTNLKDHPFAFVLINILVFFFSLMFASLRAGLVTGSIARVLSNEARISEPSNLASKLAGNLRLRSDASILPLTQ